MKNLIIILICFVQLGNCQISETIYVSSKQNVFIFFDSAIRQGIPGHSNFQFAFDIENNSKFGIIRGVKGVESNLHIITANGYVYTFILKYKEKIDKFNYFISKEAAIGNVNNDTNSILDNDNDIKKDSLQVSNIRNIQDKVEIDTNNRSDNQDKFQNIRGTLYETDREEYFRKVCYYDNWTKPYFKRYLTESGDVIFYLDEIKHIKDEIYIRLRIHNKSGVDYETNFVGFSKVSKKKNKRSSSQAIFLKPVYEYNPFKRVESGKELAAIYVFDKFGIGKNKVLNIEFNEKNGERNAVISVLSRDVINVN